MIRAIAAAGHAIVGETFDLDATVALARELLPDAVVVDGRLPGTTIDDALRRIREVAPHAALLVVVSLAERELLRTALAAGAAAGVLRPLRPSDISAALARVANGTS